MKRNKTFVAGALFGLIAPIIGLFIGLQINSILGSILLFPIVLLSSILEQPFGMFTLPLKLFSIFLSVLGWGLLFVLIKTIGAKLKR